MSKTKEKNKIWRKVTKEFRRRMGEVKTPANGAEAWVLDTLVEACAKFVVLTGAARLNRERGGR